MISKISIKTRSFLLTVMFVLLTAATGFAATYYVDAGQGNDSNNGLSESSPWRSISKVNGTTFNPGDNILFKKGQSWNGQLAPSSNGAAGAPITFGAYGNGDLPTIDATGYSYCIKWDKSYITVDGLHLTKSGKNGIGQWSGAADYGVLRNSLIDYNARQGLYTGASATVNCENWLIENNTFAHNGSDTVLDHGIYTKWAKGWIIQGNTFLNNAAFAINLNGSSDAVIRYNYSSGNGQGFVDFFEDTAGASTNNKIYYNVSNGDRRFLYLGGSSNHTGNAVYNNTAYDFAYGGINDDKNNSDLVVKNNILWSSRAPAYKLESGTFSANSSNNNLGPERTGFIKYGGVNYSTLESLQSAYPGFENGSTTEDPLFVNPGIDLHISENSPCKSSGENLSLERDIDGILLTPGAPPSIGAYELQTTVATISAPKNVRILVQ